MAVADTMADVATTVDVDIMAAATSIIEEATRTAGIPAGTTGEGTADADTAVVAVIPAAVRSRVADLASTAVAVHAAAEGAFMVVEAEASMVVVDMAAAAGTNL